MQTGRLCMKPRVQSPGGKKSWNLGSAQLIRSKTLNGVIIHFSFLQQRQQMQMDKWSYIPHPLLRNPAVKVSFVCAVPHPTSRRDHAATVHTHHCYCKFALRLQHVKMFTGLSWLLTTIGSLNPGFSPSAKFLLQKALRAGGAGARL